MKIIVVSSTSVSAMKVRPKNGQLVRKGVKVKWGSQAFSIGSELFKSFVKSAKKRGIALDHKVIMNSSATISQRRVEMILDVCNENGLELWDGLRMPKRFN